MLLRKMPNHSTQYNYQQLQQKNARNMNKKTKWLFQCTFLVPDSSKLQISLRKCLLKVKDCKVKTCKHIGHARGNEYCK